MTIAFEPRVIAQALHDHPERRAEILAVVNATDTPGEERLEALRTLLGQDSEHRTEGAPESRQEAPETAQDAEAEDRAAEQAREAQEASQRAAIAAAGPLARVTERRAAYVLPSLAEYRALATTSGTAGVLVPREQSSSWYDMLRPASVVLSAGPRVLNMAHRELVVPRIAASTAVAQVAEGQPIALSDPQFAGTTLVARKSAALTLINNETLSDSDPSVRELATYDHIKAVGQHLDRQMLEGDGSGENMRGIRRFTGDNVTPLGTNGASLTVDHLADMVSRLEGNNGNLSRAAFFTSARSWATLRKAKDSGGAYIVTQLVADDPVKRLFGIPVCVGAISNAETVGTSNDCSWIGLVDLDQLVVGRRQDVEVVYSQDYAFNSDQTAVRTIARFDIAPLDPRGVEILTGVRP